MAAVPIPDDVGAYLEALEVDGTLDSILADGVTSSELSAPLPGLLGYFGITDLDLKRRVRDAIKLTLAAALADVSSSITTTNAGLFDGTCDAALAVGDLVYISGSSSAVERVNIALTAEVPVIGVVISKPTATTCKVQTQGIVRNVYSGLTPNGHYFCDNSGRPTLVRPNGTDSLPVFLISTGYALDATTLLLRPHVVAIVSS